MILFPATWQLSNQRAKHWLFRSLSHSNQFREGARCRCHWIGGNRGWLTTPAGLFFPEKSPLGQRDGMRTALEPERQDGLCNLQDPVQNENAGPLTLKKILYILSWLQQSTKAFWDCTDPTPMMQSCTHRKFLLRHLGTLQETLFQSTDCSQVLHL